MSFNIFEDNKQTNEFFNAMAGLSLIAAGASMVMANPAMRTHMRDVLRATFPDLNVDQEVEMIRKVALEQPLTMILSSLLPDLEKYLALRAM